MSNLKKILAMVLVFSMVLSMGITAGAGMFSDVSDDHEYARAINLLASLDVLSGFDDGTYQPEGVYTREQAAKILYVLMNGKDDEASIYKGNSPFPDVAADRWSAGYITWAKEAKVLVGREDGSFYPTDEVTYAEFAKMLVVAMGYDSTVYTFPYGFIDKAQTMGIFDDVSGMTANGSANRGSVAQMAFNALFADAPRFGTYVAAVGGTSTTETKTKTVAMGAFAMMETTATLLGTSTNAGSSTFTDEGQVSLYNTATSAPIHGRYDYDANVDMYVGTDVVVWYREAKTQTGTGVDSKEMIFDIQPKASVEMFMFNATDINDMTADELDVEIDGVDKTFDIDLLDGAGVAGDEFEVGSTMVTFSNGDMFIPVGVATEEVAIDPVDGTSDTSLMYKAVDNDGDGMLDVIMISAASTAKVSSLTSSRIIFSNAKGMVVTAGSKDLMEGDATVVNVEGGIGAGDYVYVTSTMQYVEDEGMEEIFNVTMAEVIDEAKITRKSGSTIYLDGVAVYEAGEAGSLGQDPFNASIGDTFMVVKNINGDVVYSEKVSASASTNDWFLVTGMTYTAGATAAGNYVSSLTGYTTDGSKKTFVIADDAELNGTEIAPASGAAWNTITVDELYYYSTNSDGELAELMELADAAAEFDLTGATVGAGAATAVTYNASTTVLGGNYVDAGTVIFFMEAEYDAGGAFTGYDYSVVEIDALDDFTTGVAQAGYIADGKELQAVLLVGDSIPTEKTDTYGYVISAEVDASGDDVVYSFEVAYDGKVEVIKTDAMSQNSVFDGYVSDDDTLGFYMITFDSNGLVDDLDPALETEMTLDNATGTDVYRVNHMIVETALDAAAIGLKVTGSDMITNTNADSASSIDWMLGAAKYSVAGNVVTNAGNYDELTLEFADDVNVYVVDDSPVGDHDGREDGAGILDDAVAVSVTSVSSITETSEGANMIASFLTNDDGEVIEVFVYTDPVEDNTAEPVLP